MTWLGNLFQLLLLQISNLDEFEDGQNYVCLCNNENFKKIEYSSQPLSQVGSTKTSNRLSKVIRPLSPLKNGSSTSNGTNGSGSTTNSTNGYSLTNALESIVHPRIVTLIRNGTKPRRIHRLLLNKRNSPSYEHILQAITQCVKLDTGCVRKVFTMAGQPVLTLADFFQEDNVFFAYGNERMSQDDFKLEADELKGVQQTRKSAGNTRNGPKPQMPIKNSVNLHNTTFPCDDAEDDSDRALLTSMGLPEIVQDKYHLGAVIGDGNFAFVLKVIGRDDGRDYALKVIDKSKCKGKEHYIDAEVRVMKKLNHPHIMQLIMDVDTTNNMFLVLEYVSGEFDRLVLFASFWNLV